MCDFQPLIQTLACFYDILRKDLLRKIHYIIFFFFLAVSPGLYASPDLSKPRVGTEERKNQLDYCSIDSIVSFGKEYLGKPYRYRGATSWPLDCSGYISFIFGKFNISLPHSAGGISKVVEPVPLADVRKGDLMFFKGRSRNNPRVGHVSMVIDNTNGDITMLHSCSRGIIIERYNTSDYYTRRFLGAGRVVVAQASPSAQVMKEEVRALTVILPPKEDTISIIGVGDMMLGTNYPNSGYLPPKDGKEILAPVKELLADADVTFGNLEGVLLTAEGTVKKCNDPSVCYAFKSPEHYVKYFKEAGFDVVNIANNHFSDFGEEGRVNTMKTLDEAQIHYAGLLRVPWVTFVKDSVKYGFCGFAPTSGSVNFNDLKKAAQIVRHLDSVCDIVIVSFHGGGEGANYRHVTRQNESFIGENRGNPYAFARAVIDAGADVVFGHGPHVPRAIDLYKDRFIAYSLGNFATYARFNLRGSSGLAPIVKVKVNKKGVFQEARIISTKQLGEGGPQLDSENKVLKEIMELTQTDIPEAPLTISEEGIVRKK